MNSSRNYVKKTMNNRHPLRTFLPLLLMLLSLVAGEAKASVSFSETFLGGRTDGDYYNVWQDYSARFAFNLTTAGETATLYNAQNQLVSGSTKLPTTDETHFVANQFLIDSAKLNFTFSSSDAAAETIKIKTGFSDGNNTLWVGAYTLGNIVTEILNKRRYADLKLDLVALGYSHYLVDGRFVSFVIAPDLAGCTLNDFTIDQANLSVSATPTPIPAAAWLLGSGLLGLAGLRRKQQ